MAIIARVIGLSLATALFGAWLGFAIFGGKSDSTFASVLFGCVGTIVGALAGAAYEIASALRRKPYGDETFR